MNSDFTSSFRWSIYTLHKGQRKIVTTLLGSEHYMVNICSMLNQARAGMVTYLYCLEDEWSKVESWEKIKGYRE